MTTQIDPERLKKIRTMRGMTQKTLGQKAKINPQTIYRIEAGKEPNNRGKTIETLCRVLEVEPDLLRGETPIPDSILPIGQTVNDNDYTIAAQINAPQRNAYHLVSRRYGVSNKRIAELAPFLFALAAEQSLEHRRNKLAALEELFDGLDALKQDFPHLPRSITPDTDDNEALFAEQDSIKERDIFSDRLSDKVNWDSGSVEEYYEPGEHNPFVQYLKGVSSKFGNEVVIDSFHASDATSYRVCCKDAFKLADGDEEIAKGILFGSVLLHEMPHEFFEDEAKGDRLNWLRNKIREENKRSEEAFQNLIRELKNELGEKKGADS